MGRYLPGAILAVVGVAVYVIGCVVYIAYRRQRGQAPANKSLLVYAIAMIGLGALALGAGLYALELTQIRALGG